MIELKTMTGEELSNYFINRVDSEYTGSQLFEELESRLNRLDEVEKENKELKERLENVPKECEVCPEKKQLRKQVEDLGAERDNAMVAYENLKCCGNCINYIYDMEEDHHYCNKNIFNGKRHAGICSNNWQSDTMTREDRK